MDATSLSAFRALLVFVLWACTFSLAHSSTPTSESVSFRNGEVSLEGTLYLPAEPGPFPSIVAFHAANGGTRDYHAYLHLVTALPKAGFAVLLFDRRGSGASSGDFDTATFMDLAADGIAGVSYLKSRREIDPARIGVFGISQGGWLAPLAATMSPDIAFVVAVSGPGVSPARQMDYGATYALSAAGEAANVIDRALSVRAIVNDYYRGRATRTDTERAVEAIRHERWFDKVYLPSSGNLPVDPKHTKWFVEMDYDPLDAIARVRVPMAIFFAQTDRWVPVEESIVAVRKATQSNSTVMIFRVPGTDHLMETGKPDSGQQTSEQYVKQLLAWLQLVVTK
jgi:pimeloyl-ACP methyl ester carboxylesterase